MNPKSITIAGAAFPWGLGMEVIVETQESRRKLLPLPGQGEEREVLVSTTIIHLLRIARPDAGTFALADAAFGAGCRVGFDRAKDILSIELCPMEDGEYYRFNME